MLLRYPCVCVLLEISRDSSCCRRFVTVAVLGTLTAFNGPDQPHLGSHPHLCMPPGVYLSSLPRAFIPCLCCRRAGFQLGHSHPCAWLWNLLVWVPTFDFLTWTCLITLWSPDGLGSWLVLGCYSEVCPACCAWIPWGCTQAGEVRQVIVLSSWLPAPQGAASPHCALTGALCLPAR